MLARPFVAAGLIALCCATSLFAQDLDPRIAAVKPFIAKNTASVIHVDLRKLDLKTAVDRLKKLAPPGTEAIQAQVNVFVPVVAGVRNQLIEAGASDIFAFASDEEGAAGFSVLPLETGKDPEAVIGILKGLPGSEKAEMFAQGDAVVIGDPGLKEKIAAITPARAAEFSYCMKLAGATDFQFILLPTAGLADRTFARVPGGEAAGAAVKEHADKVRAVVLTANLPPRSALAIYVKMKDEATATEIMDKIKEGLAGEDAKAATDHPIFGKLVTAVTPKQEKEMLKIVLTEPNGGIDALANSVKEGLSLLAPLLAGGGPPGFGPPGGAGGVPPGLPPGVRPPPGTTPPGGAPGEDPFK